MELRVNSRSHVPVHVQLQEQLKHLILTGDLAVGSRLPSIRVLAGYLRINRNTVARVVADLEREGFLETRRGSGTYVLEPPVDAKGMERQRFLERVMRQAAEEGVPVEELGYALLARAGAPIPGRTPVLFVECNEPELLHYAAALEERLPVIVEKVLLEDLPERLLREGDPLPWRLAVTTFYHVHEVEEAVGGRGIETVALLAEETLDSIQRLTELPAGTKVGVLGNSRTCSENVLSSLVGSGMDHLKLFQIYEDASRDLGEQLEEAEVVVCGSPMAGRLSALGLPPTGTEVILQDRTLDKGGIEMLGRMLRDVPRETVGGQS